MREARARAVSRRAWGAAVSLPAQDGVELPLLVERVDVAEAAERPPVDEDLRDGALPGRPDEPGALLLVVLDVDLLVGDPLLLEEHLRARAVRADPLGIDLDA